MTTSRKGELVVQRLESFFGHVRFDDDFWRQRNEPFWLIVHTILSQNTSNTNSGPVLRKMLIKYETLEGVYLANGDDIERDIRPAGLYETKAKSICAVATEIVEHYRGDTWSFLGGRYESARARLREVVGIGPKTADVVLLFARDFDIVPVDTHVFRVSRRLGLAPQKGGYEVVKTSLEGEIPRGKRKFAHTALIKFGREICSARRPQHWKCPLTDVCTYFQEMSSVGNSRINA